MYLINAADFLLSTRVSLFPLLQPARCQSGQLALRHSNVGMMPAQRGGTLEHERLIGGDAVPSWLAELFVHRS